MGIAANFTIVTLGVADLGASIDFYRRLGWEQRGDGSAGIAWFRTAATWIGLFGHDALAADTGAADAAGRTGDPADPAATGSSAQGPPAFRGITLALNFNTDAEVDAALDEAVAAGARLVKPATRAEWGVYSGYFADPDGHLWEAACAPEFPVADDGTIDIYPAAPV